MRSVADELDALFAPQWPRRTSCECRAIVRFGKVDDVVSPCAPEVVRALVLTTAIGLVVSRVVLDGILGRVASAAKRRGPPEPGFKTRFWSKRSVMLESLVRQFLYYPTKLPVDEPPPRYVRGAREVWLDADDGNRLHGLRWLAPEGRPTILFFHGNAQSAYEWALLEPELAPLGCGLLIVDYPGYGKSTGEPAEAGLYAAGRGALAWLVAEGVAERSIVIFGKSLGGPVAVEAARGRAVRGVILESTFRSVLHVARRLLPMLPPGATLQSERYDAASGLGELRAPLLVVHGTDDELIPVVEGTEIFALAPEPKELYLVEGAGHNDVSYVAGADYVARLRRWLEAL